MNKKKKQSLTLRQTISIGLSILFLITLSGAAKWANYRQTFDLFKINFYGYNILQKTDYEEILSQFKVHSIYDFDLREIAETIENNPFVRAAQISRQYPNKIRVNIVERKPLAIINLKEQLMIDGDAVILPNHHYINSVLIPILSGFNPEKDLYPHGEKTYSIKVRESVSILNQLSDSFPNLYNNISELTLNNNDEYVIILSDKPTRVILGKDNILKKLNILKNFDKALGQRQLTDFQLLDMRYNKQLIAREWT